MHTYYMVKTLTTTLLVVTTLVACTPVNTPGTLNVATAEHNTTPVFSDYPEFVEYWLESVGKLEVTDECISAGYELEIHFVGFEDLLELSYCDLTDCIPRGRSVASGPKKGIYLLAEGVHDHPDGKLQSTLDNTLETAIHEAAHVAYRCMGITNIEAHHDMMMGLKHVPLKKL